MKPVHLSKEIVLMVFLAFFVLGLNILCNYIVAHLYNPWRPLEPDFTDLLTNPYPTGNWKGNACFSDSASEAYFSRVKESGTGNEIKVDFEASGGSGLDRQVSMIVNRGGKSFFETASVVNGCIETFSSVPAGGKD